MTPSSQLSHGTIIALIKTTANYWGPCQALIGVLVLSTSAGQKHARQSTNGDMFR